MSDLNDTIKAVQALMRQIPKVRAAPDYAPEKIDPFPFVACFPGTGVVEFGAAGVKKGLHNLRLQLHVARKDLERDIAAAAPFVDSITDKLLGDPTLGGTVSTFARITYTFRPMNWNGIDTIGWDFIIEGIKQENNVS